METTSTDAPSILLIHNPQIPEQYLAELQKDLAGLTHNVRTQKGEPGIQGAPEWVLPAAIALLIGKGLLDGFLREFGADTARALKKTVGKVLKRVKAKPIKWFSVAGKPTGVSPLLSVEFVLESSEHCYRAIKFTFPHDLEEKSRSRALDRLPSAIANAVAAEDAILEQRGSFRGYRVAGYVFPPDRTKWLAITADLLMNQHRTKRDEQEQIVPRKSQKKRKKNKL